MVYKFSANADNPQWIDISALNFSGYAIIGTWNRDNSKLNYYFNGEYINFIANSSSIREHYSNLRVGLVTPTSPSNFDELLESISQLSLTDLEDVNINNPTVGQGLEWDGDTWDNADIGGGVSDGDKGDITVSMDGEVWTINNSVVSNTKLASVTQNTIKGRVSTGSGTVEDLTASQVRTIINVENGATANQTNAYLLDRANHTGTQAQSTIVGLTDALSTIDSDITSLESNKQDLNGNLTGLTSLSGTGLVKRSGVNTFILDSSVYLTENQNITFSGDLSGSGTTGISVTIGADVVDNTKLSNMATSTIKGRVTAGTGNPEDLTVAQVKTLLSYVKGDIGLGNVDNTSDANKPVSTAQQTALDLKQDEIILTTTGTSGAATLIGSTLNIPQYSGGGGGGLSQAQALTLVSFR